MNHVVRDTWTRRASLLPLGAALASLARPLAGDAKQKCKQQIDECVAVLEGECANDPACLACCEFAGRCDFAGLVTCVNDAQSGGEQ